MSAGAWVVVVAVVAAVGFGLYRARTEGRFRPARATTPAAAKTEAATEAAAPVEPVEPVAPAEPDLWGAVRRVLPAAELGERATLLQFSSAFCAPCRATRRTLGEVAELVPGVVHLEVDAEQHLDLVRTVGVLRTPTTLVLDERGREVTRASGAPRKEQVLAALGQA